MTKTGTPARRTGNAQARRVQQIAAHWNALGPVNQRAWNIAHETLIHPTEPGLPTIQSGYGLYVASASTLLDTSGSMPPVQPAGHAPPLPVPPCVLSGSYAQGQLTITLTPKTAYAAPALVYFAPPAVGGLTTWKPSSYKLCGTLDTIPSPCDLTEMFLSRYRVGSYGYQISVKVVGYNADGVRGVPLFISGFIVGLSADSDAGTHAPQTDADAAASGPDSALQMA